MTKNRILGVTVLAICVLGTITGCVKPPTHQQITMGEKNNIKLSNGGSIALYVVALPTAIKAIKSVMDKSFWLRDDYSKDRVGQWVTLADIERVREKSEYITVRKKSNTQCYVKKLAKLQSDEIIYSYMSFWGTGKGDYVVKIQPLDAKRDDTYIVTISTLIADFCEPSDYDTFIQLHQEFRRHITSTQLSE